MGKERKLSEEALTHWLGMLTREEKLVIADQPDKAKQALTELARQIEANIFVKFLSDEEAISFLIEHGADKYLAKAAVIVWRWYASDCGYTGPIAWRVKKGFTLKIHAPQAGPCYQELEYLRDWEFRNDDPTKDSLVFWVPRLVKGSTGKSVEQMELRRAQLRRFYGLPKNHCRQFGSISLLFALILAHFKRTGERVPLHLDYAVSDTLYVNGKHLISGYFGGSGISCRLRDDGHGDDNVGFFLIGVEELGQIRSLAL